jgi:hypothetical protein
MNTETSIDTIATADTIIPAVLKEQILYFSLLSIFLNSISFNEINETKLAKLTELLNHAIKKRENMTSIWTSSMDSLITRIRFEIETINDDWTDDIEWEEEEYTTNS